VDNEGCVGMVKTDCFSGLVMVGGDSIVVFDLGTGRVWGLEKMYKSGRYRNFYGGKPL
jgi:hypothetical protein